MTDKGFTQGLREIVADMMNPDIGSRPDAMRLVDKVEDGWRAWRANTKEGREYVDVRDQEFGDNFDWAARARRGAIVGL
jgi:hypothetical protein